MRDLFNEVGTLLQAGSRQRIAGLFRTVAGNHEFYRRIVERDEVAGLCAAAHSATVYFLTPTLDCGVVVIDGVRFVGATLWTDFLVHKSALEPEQDRERRRRINMDAAFAGMSDFRLIGKRTATSKWDRFLPRDALRLHERDVAYLDAALAQPFDGPSVVVTHHAPHPLSVGDKFAGDPLNPAFHSDLSDMIERRRPDLWVHGHMHSSVDYMVGETRVLANPKGYGPHLYHEPERIENRDFDPFLVIDIPTPKATDDETAGWRM